MDINNSTPQQIETKTPAPTAIRKRSRKRNTTIFIVVCLLNAALLLIIGSQLITPAPNQNQSSVSVNSSFIGDINSPLLGKPAPDFALSTLTEPAGTLHLADLKGKPVILNFWASWCEPCNAETPFLQKSWPSLKDQGVTFIGIDGPEKTDNGLAFVKKYSVTYANVQDTLNGATAIDYGVTSFPETVFINRAGIVVAKWLGPLNDAALKFEMSRLTR